MSQNLTQPEEIDRILMAIGGSEITADTPIPDGAQSSGNARNSGCGGSVREADFSYGATPAKTLDCRRGFNPACRIAAPPATNE